MFTKIKFLASVLVQTLFYSLAFFFIFAAFGELFYVWPPRPDVPELLMYTAKLIMVLVFLYIGILIFRETYWYRGLVSFANTFWQAQILLAIKVFVVTRYGPIIGKIEPELAWSYLIEDIPYIIWSIIGLIQLRRKIPFTPKIIVAHVVAFLVCNWWLLGGWRWFRATFL